jgi:hypothetical protein
MELREDEMMRSIMKTMSFFVLFGMLAAVAIVPEGCTVGKTFTKTPPPEVSPEARVLYEKTFSKEGMPTSDVVVTSRERRPIPLLSSSF